MNLSPFLDFKMFPETGPISLSVEIVGDCFECMFGM